MLERLSHESGYAFNHSQETFRALGFRRREIAGLWVSDLVVALIQEDPNHGGIWPSDVQIQFRIEDLGIHLDQFLNSPVCE